MPTKNRNKVQESRAALSSLRHRWGVKLHAAATARAEALELLQEAETRLAEANDVYIKQENHVSNLRAELHQANDSRRVLADNCKHYRQKISNTADELETARREAERQYGNVVSLRTRLQDRTNSLKTWRILGICGWLSALGLTVHLYTGQTIVQWISSVL
jgi:chromosome segregation ATPase